MFLVTLSILGLLNDPIMGLLWIAPAADGALSSHLLGFFLAPRSSADALTLISG